MNGLCNTKLNGYSHLYAKLPALLINKFEH